MTPAPDRARYAVGEVLAGRFRIVRFLGRGGMGEVYEAADLDLNQHIALKLIRPESRSDPRLLSLLRAEVRKARSISHANVCRVFDLERDDAAGVAFVTMELLRGETLHARLKRAGRFTPDEALVILRQLAGGMDAIHSRRILHLDLKPANVMIETGDSQPFRVVVNDFGLARSHAPKDTCESTETLVPSSGGTPAYMSPERFFSGAPLTSAADVYAFGLVAYEMLAGRALSGRAGAPPPPLRSVVPDAPPAWEAMVGKCLAARPEDRFATCGAAVSSLAGTVPSRPASPRWTPRRRRILAFAVAALAVALAALLLWPAAPIASEAAMRWYNDGVDAIREGTYYKAVRALDQALKESPGFSLAHASLAEAWTELDSPERASEEMVLATAPGDRGSRFGSRERERLQAIRHIVTRDFAAAVKDYTHLAETAQAAQRPRALVDLGRVLERASDPRKATAQFEAAVRLDPSYAGGYLRLAMVQGQLKQFDKMDQSLHSAETLYEASSNLEGVTEVFYQRGASLNRQARLNDAARWLDRARQSALVTRNPHQEIRALYQLSAVAYQRGDSAAGEKFAQDAIREARANNIEFLAGRGYIDLGNAFATRGEYAKAGECFNEALRIARNYHNGKLEATALYSLGSIGIRTRNDEGSARQVEQALAWFQPNGYPEYASQCLLQLGIFRRDRGDLDAAAQAFGQQLELARAAHDDLPTALALSSVASVLIRQERFPEALALTQENLAICRRLGDLLRAGYAQQRLARLYAELGRFTESEAAAREADATAQKGNVELMGNVAVVRARALLLAGRAREAAQMAEGALRVYDPKYPQTTAELLEIMALAQRDAPVSTRLAWCQRASKLAQGSFGIELSMRLTEAELQLDARNPQRAFDLCQETRGAFERQQSEYSLFRTQLIAALAARELGKKGGDDRALAAAALERFHKRFDGFGWEAFRARPDFVAWEKKLQQLDGK